jgi:hypothetical protein
MRPEIRRYAAGVVAIALLVLGIFVFFIAKPGFTEPYVKALLAKHDQTLASAEWDSIKVTTDLGKFDELHTGNWFSDPKSYVGFRKADIARDVVTKKIAHAEIIVIGSQALDIGAASRRFTCPNETEFNISARTTDDYFYFAAAGNGLSRIALDTFLNESGYSPEEPEPSRFFTEPSTNSTPGVTHGEVSSRILWMLTTAMHETVISRIMYFSPEEKDMYDKNYGIFMQYASSSACKEVSV